MYMMYISCRKTHHASEGLNSLHSDHGEIGGSIQRKREALCSLMLPSGGKRGGGRG